MAVLAIGAVAAWAAPVGYGLLAFNVATTVASYLFAPKLPNQYLQGPRLGDLKVQSSAYGNPVPIVYGAARIAGNMIWAADIVETAHTTTTSSGGGKGGGGGGSVTQTNYTYSQSFAISICEGEIAGIRKIWANGKLIYNLSDTADVATIISSNKSAAGIRIYTGSETQTADSLIQAHVGAADTPAYRGTAYIVFENLQLEAYGNRTPNLEFEVVDSGTDANMLSAVGSLVTGYTMRTVIVSGIYAYATTGNGNLLHVFDISTPSNPILIGSTATGNNSSGLAVSDGYAYVVNANSSNMQIFSVSNPAAPSLIGSVALGTNPYAVVVYGNYAYAVNYTSHTLQTINISIKSAPAVVSSVAINTSSYALARSGNYLYVANYIGNTLEIFSLATPAVPALVGSIATGGNPHGVAISGDYAYVVNSGSGTLQTFDISSKSAPASLGTVATGSSPYSIAISGNYAYVANYGSATLQVYDLSTPSAPVSLGTIATGTNPHYVNVSGGCIYEVNIGSYSLQSFFFSPDVISITAASLSSIVSNICTRAGLTAGQIDVTALTDEVHGYVVQRGTARSQIEQLMQAFYFDAVESDGKVKFVKRGGSSAVSIPEDDLAAHEYGSSPPDTLVTNRRQEMELPVELNVQYMDSAAAYAVGSQYSQRLTTESENKTSLNFAIAMTATKAKQIADVLMYDAWTSRMTFDLQTGWKYCYLEPTDIITVTKGGRTYVMRIVDEDFSITSRRQCVLEDTTVYTQSATAAGLPTPGETVASVPLTNLMLLDIPLLRDADDGYGFYVAACGYGDGWTGAQPFKSNDGGATWTSFGSGMLNESTIGTASTALGDFTQNIFDELNSVTVVLLNGELSSDTEINILNGANVALIGDEIIQFRDATLTATNTYVLTGFLRGRQGTEWARSTHAIGDRFVLITTTTTYPMFGAVSEYDLDREYRGVSFGGFLDDATTITFQNTAVQAIPYSPVHLGGGRNAAGDLTLAWIRRTRISGGWNNYSDVPLGEATEAYVVEIYDDSAYTTVVRTITGITSATTSYTAAEQTTDFGAPQSTVYWKVYQVSATVGNGYEARGIS